MVEDWLCQIVSHVVSLHLLTSIHRMVKNIHTEIEVNKPFSIDGWKIYQLSYNEQMGKWSNLSIFEIVTDPWMPVVYVGIFMLLFGAVGMFLTASRKKEVKL